jgi:hypothetical protein
VVGFVEEEAALLARREQERLRELGEAVVDEPRWRWNRRLVRVQPSGNVYSVLTSASRTDAGAEGGLIGYVEVGAPGTGGLGGRLRARFEITRGAYARLPERVAPMPAYSTLRSALGDWPRAARLLIAASIALIAIAAVLMPLTTESGRPGWCEGTVTSSPVAFAALALAYLVLAAIPVAVWRVGLAGSRPARFVVLLVTLWIGLVAFWLPYAGGWAHVYLALSAFVWIPALLVTAIDGRNRPNATPGLLGSVTVLSLVYYGLTYLVSPHVEIC